MRCRILLAISIGCALSLVGCGDDAIEASCSAMCTVAEECVDNTDLSECMNVCAERLREAESISPECANAVRGQLFCGGELTCAEVAAWLGPGFPPDANPCKSADEAVADACLL